MSMLEKETAFKTLYDHYQDTFGHIKFYRGQRDRLFSYVLIVVVLMLFQLFSPKEAGGLISQIIGNQLEMSIPLETSFIGSIIWFILLALVVRYFQRAVLLERQYEYIHKLEEYLSSNYEINELGIFSREGKYYLSNYPLFSNWTAILYTILFPFLLLSIVGIKIINEIAEAGTISTLLIFNILIALLIVISTVLYLSLIHFGK